jgi:hypothetical protein
MSRPGKLGCLEEDVAVALFRLSAKAERRKRNFNVVDGLEDSKSFVVRKRALTFGGIKYLEIYRNGDRCFKSNVLASAEYDEELSDDVVVKMFYNAVFSRYGLYLPLP